MFTVVIAEQEHIDAIREYRAFLSPFLGDPNIAFCRWLPEGESLSEAVPELSATVSRHEQWRLIAVCGEEGLHLRNPFDLVGHADPPMVPGMEEAEYRALRRQARSRSYALAARKPLTRLATWLCRPPLVTGDSSDAEALDPEFGEYIAQAREKEALRRRIMDSCAPQTALPREILCLAKRCCDREALDLRDAWAARQDSLYSRFCDWNLYFDAMRFLAFDILPRDHRDYAMDYIRFLYALMLLASREIPASAMSPGLLYTLDCRNDTQALRSLLLRYDRKLASTEEQIRTLARKLRSKEPPRLSDEDAASIFCSRVNVPVSSGRSADTDGLTVPLGGLGLAADCPEREVARWERDTRRSRDALGKYLKGPRRAVIRASKEVRRLSTADLEQVMSLNSFQLEDVKAYVEEEELKLAATPTGGLELTEQAAAELELRRRQAEALIEGRMTWKRVLSMGLTGTVCCLVSLIPMLPADMTAGSALLPVFFAAAAAAMMLSALGNLLLQRLRLRKTMDGYNKAVKDITDEAEQSAARYARYLSHTCNVMRGWSVLNCRAGAEDPTGAKLRILKKHETDIRCLREELREIFGTFLPDSAPQTDPDCAYHYDFQRPVDYTYPVPFREDKCCKIEFLQRGNWVEVPVDFVSSIHLRREDLYD